jgi:hypothetical protein
VSSCYETQQNTESNVLSKVLAAYFKGKKHRLGIRSIRSVVSTVSKQREGRAAVGEGGGAEGRDGGRERERESSLSHTHTPSRLGGAGEGGGAVVRERRAEVKASVVVSFHADVPSATEAKLGAQVCSFLLSFFVLSTVKKSAFFIVAVRGASRVLPL